MWLSTFKTDEEAARAFNEAAMIYHDPNVKLNFLPTNEDSHENTNNFET